jgi:hypothetical protein
MFKGKGLKPGAFQAMGQQTAFNLHRPTAVNRRRRGFAALYEAVGSFGKKIHLAHLHRVALGPGRYEPHPVHLLVGTGGLLTREFLV